MRRYITIFAVVASILLLLWQSFGSISAAGPGVLVIKVNGAIEPLTVDHIARGIDDARKNGASLVVIELNTPGGWLDSTRDIVEILLESEIPIAVYVTPAGARAASAGTFIAAAANFAVMAPGTNIGAASPVASDGGEFPETLSRKINEDTRAFIRSIAQVRGRNAGALEDTVLTAKSYSAQEAVDLGVVDFVATDLNDMLAQLEGRETTTPNGQIVISANGGEVRTLDHTVLERTLGFLAGPNVIFVLFLIGGIALLAELVIPGLFGPGIVGVIALALAFVGFANLPGSWVGVALIALSMGLFYGETTAPGFGVFGAGGIVSMILGSVFLFGNFFSPSDLPEPSFMVSPIMIGIMTGLMIATWVLFIRVVNAEGGISRGFQTEAEMLLEGQWGVALSDLQPSGKVWVSNEEWAASTDPGVSIKEGEEVRVVGVYGQVLKVVKLYEDLELSNQA